jgi:hypothetical protein
MLALWMTINVAIPTYELKKEEIKIIAPQDSLAGINDQCFISSMVFLFTYWNQISVIEVKIKWLWHGLVGGMEFLHFVNIHVIIMYILMLGGECTQIK